MTTPSHGESAPTHAAAAEQHVKSKAIGGIAGGAMLAVFALIAAWLSHGDGATPAHWLTVLTGLSGVAAGWLAGFLASPYTTAEGGRFVKYGSLVSLFLSGFLLAKLEPAMGAVFGKEGFVANPVYAVRLLTFAICFIVGSITMYVFRLYLHVGEPWEGKGLGDDAVSEKPS